VGVSSESLEGVMAREYSSMLAIGLALLGDDDEARELAQETMLRLQQHWPHVSTLDRPGAWCRRVALNLANDSLRARTRRRRLTARLASTPPAGGVSDDWDRTFWAAVGELPERQRSAVVLHYVHDLRIDDVAEILEAPVGTVKSDLSRAREWLRARLGEDRR